MSLCVAFLGPASSKEGRDAMLISDTDISRMIVYVEQVKKDKMRDREGYLKNKAMSRNECGQQKGGSS